MEVEGTKMNVRRDMEGGGRENVFKPVIARDFIFRSKCTKNIWRPGSARTSWGSLSAPPGPVAGLGTAGVIRSSSSSSSLNVVFPRYNMGYTDTIV
jgi:hypothetical protein